MHRAHCCVVDDDDRFLEFASRCVGELCPSSEIVRFYSGLDALAYLRRTEVDLVLTDLWMPFVNGLRLAAEIRRSDAVVPIFIMSNHAAQVEAMAPGVNALVPKPTFVASLAGALHQLARRNRRIARLFAETPASPLARVA